MYNLFAPDPVSIANLVIRYSYASAKYFISSLILKSIEDNSMNKLPIDVLWSDTESPKIGELRLISENKF